MITTRIAPSPTGPFHLGSARTALFNFLFARKNRGKFLLRIEDTDKKRSRPQYEKDIFESLSWLGLNFGNSQNILKQSQRGTAYKKACQILLKQNWAYKKEGAVYFALEDFAQKNNLEKVEFEDLIRGKISFEIDDLQDFVILKKDGSPTYHLAVVVDDAFMKISHIIRGEDHLSNTPKHILLQKALGLETLIYAHLPLILNPDRTKMSSRRDPISITQDFRKKGFLPEAMLNFLALLGWAPSTNREIFSQRDLIKEFSLERVQKSPAIFDENKLNSLNREYLSKFTTENLAKLLKGFWQETKVAAPPFKDKELTNLVETLRDRITTLSDFLSLLEASTKLKKYSTPLLIFKKSSKLKSRQGLESTLRALEKAEQSNWKKEKLLGILEAVVRKEKLGNGDVFWPVRVALSGKAKSPPPEELLYLSGKPESLRRIKAAIQKLKSNC